MSESQERYPVGPRGMQGVRGAQGNQGNRGERGQLSRVQGRAVVVLFLLAALFGAGNLFWTAREVGGLRTSVLSACAFTADLASAPVVPPTGGAPSKLGVSIVADSRAQWRQLGCPGHIAPPQPSFVKWARFYHLPSQ